MVNLDDQKTYEKLDPGDMRGRILELPQQCRKAWQQAQDFKLPPDYADIDRVIVLGMGGSAIGGDLLRGLVAAESKVSISVIRDYDAPSFIDSNTLIIASSYSGMTEETLTSFIKTLASPAKKVAITTGGKLRDIAHQNSIPVFAISYVAQPRAALAYSLFPLLGICQNLGFVGSKSREVAETAQVLENMQTAIGLTCPASDNPAKKLAINLYNHLAIIYGAGIFSAVAQRWKTQINENSKAWAFYEVFPEMNHNAVVGYQFPSKLAGETYVVLLRSHHLHTRTLKRYEIIADVLSRSGISHDIIEASGESPLTQMMSLVLFGDWVSYYLALLYETDPTPVEVIDYLKKRLAET